MSMETFLKVREMGRKVKEKRKGMDTDYKYLTAPCGLPCFECFLYLAQFDDDMALTIAGVLNVSSEDIKCKGCRAYDGKVPHISMDCNVYSCAKDKKIQTCAECIDMPCSHLHPYRDQAEKWHNTKVYHLCKIRNLGLDKWAKNEAGEILNKYFYGTWTL